MRYLLIGIGAIALVAFAVVIAGWLLPVAHHVSRESLYQLSP